MEAYVLYRLPGEHHYIRLVQHTEPQVLASPAEADGCAGFLIAPFRACEAEPLLLLKPDATDIRPLPPPPDMPASPLPPATATPPPSAAYAAAFNRCSELLRNGQCSKIVLARTEAVPLPPGATSSETLFFRACHLYPDCFVCLFHTVASGTWLVATPETLLAAEDDGWTTMALAGTLPVPADGTLPSADDFGGKNRQEQQFVTHFIGQQLVPIASRLQTAPPHVRRAGNLAHLCTPFHFASATAPLSALLQRLHPTPAVCGVPRTAVQKAICDIEPQPRRYYAGYIGPVGLLGQTRLYVTLRCMELRDTEAVLHAGGGLLPASKLQDEWEETCRKMDAIRHILI